jgi:hypothetical protein
VEVVPFTPKPKPPNVPSDMPMHLNQLLTDIESGAVSGLLIASVKNGCFEFVFGTSIHEALILSSLLHSRCLSKFNFRTV